VPPSSDGAVDSRQDLISESFKLVQEVKDIFGELHLTQYLTSSLGKVLIPGMQYARSLKRILTLWVSNLGIAECCKTGFQGLSQ
jgi:hypothetical protein